MIVNYIVAIDKWHINKIDIICYKFMTILYVLRNAGVGVLQYCFITIEHDCKFVIIIFLLLYNNELVTVYL